MHASVQTAPESKTTGQLLVDATRLLATAGIGTPRLDAEVLLAAACGVDRTGLYVRMHEVVRPQQQHDFGSLLARRRAREPLQYIVGSQEFWSLDFMVTPDVLIPRPETERLVEIALEAVRRTSEWERGLTLCDLGTGSGCIAVALARELPQAAIWGLDVSAAALAIAVANARRHGVAERLHFVHSDLFERVEPRRFEVIVANPPYVPADEMAHLQPEVTWEPRGALNGGAAGLDVIERVLTEARARLVDGGWMIMEIGAAQSAAVAGLATVAEFREVSVAHDAAGLPRVLRARR